MNIENVIFEGFPFEFLSNGNSNKLLVFLPAVNNKGIYPYYPRISWGKELSKKYNILYMADPFQHLPEYQEPMGSWFVSPEGRFILPELAKKIENFALGINAKDILFYGSSMGGFAAIILSSLIANSTAIAECPQLLLNKHPGSKHIIDNILKAEQLEIFNVEHYLSHSKATRLKIVCSFYDRHYFNHVIPFFNSLIASKFKPQTQIDFYGYMNASYKEGHVSLQWPEAKILIDETLRF